MEPVHTISQILYSILIYPVAIFSIIFYTLAVYSAKRRSRKTKMKRIREWPTVTIQIPTKDELVAIRCAEKCLNFDYPKNKIEIIIGDDSTDHEISRKIREFAKKYTNVKVTRRNSDFGYKPGNLNNMLKYSNGEILIIFDSDFVPGKKFLKKIVAPFVYDERVACVQAKWDYLNIRQNTTSKLSSSILMVYHHLIAPINNRLGISLLFGSGEAVRKSVLVELGGWKDWAMTEDVEFSLRAIKNGYKTVYLEDVTVPGEVPFTVDGLAKQQKRWAYGNTKAFLDNMKWIMFGKRFSVYQKFFLLLTLVGYVSAPIILAFIITGTVFFLTGTPGSVNVAMFLWETSRVLLINSGFLFAMLIALSKENRKKMTVHVIIASLTIGLWIAVSVFDGFLKAVTKREMKWYMIRKRGNENMLARVNAPVLTSK